MSTSETMDMSWSVEGEKTPSRKNNYCDSPPSLRSPISKNTFISHPSDTNHTFPVPRPNFFPNFTNINTYQFNLHDVLFSEFLPSKDSS